MTDPTTMPVSGAGLPPGPPPSPTGNTRRNPGVRRKLLLTAGLVLDGAAIALVVAKVGPALVPLALGAIGVVTGLAILIGSWGRPTGFWAMSALILVAAGAFSPGVAAGANWLDGGSGANTASGDSGNHKTSDDGTSNQNGAGGSSPNAKAGSGSSSGSGSSGNGSSGKANASRSAQAPTLSRNLELQDAVSTAPCGSGSWKSATPTLAKTDHNSGVSCQLGYYDDYDKQQWLGSLDFMVPNGATRFTGFAGIMDDSKSTDVQLEFRISETADQANASPGATTTGAALYDERINFGTAGKIDFDVTGRLRLRLQWRVVSGKVSSTQLPLSVCWADLRFT